jgi:hypothetical protein
VTWQCELQPVTFSSEQLRVYSRCQRLQQQQHQQQPSSSSIVDILHSSASYT